MITDLPIQAQIALAFGADKWPQLRQIALSIVSKQVLELHQHGRFEPGMRLLGRVSKRWRLGDFVSAMSAHYPF